MTLLRYAALLFRTDVSPAPGRNQVQLEIMNEENAPDSKTAIAGAAEWMSNGLKLEEEQYAT